MERRCRKILWDQLKGIADSSSLAEVAKTVASAGRSHCDNVSVVPVSVSRCLLEAGSRDRSATPAGRAVDLSAGRLQAGWMTPARASATSSPTASSSSAPRHLGNASSMPALFSADGDDRSAYRGNTYIDNSVGTCATIVTASEDNRGQRPSLPAQLQPAVSVRTAPVPQGRSATSPMSVGPTRARLPVGRMVGDESWLSAGSASSPKRVPPPRVPRRGATDGFRESSVVRSRVQVLEACVARSLSPFDR